MERVDKWVGQIDVQGSWKITRTSRTALIGCLFDQAREQQTLLWTTEKLKVRATFQTSVFSCSLRCLSPLRLVSIYSVLQNQTLVLYTHTHIKKTRCEASAASPLSAGRSCVQWDWCSCSSPVICSTVVLRATGVKYEWECSFWKLRLIRSVLCASWSLCLLPMWRCRKLATLQSALINLWKDESTEGDFIQVASLSLCAVLWARPFQNFWQILTKTLLNCTYKLALLPQNCSIQIRGTTGGYLWI